MANVSIYTPISVREYCDGVRLSAPYVKVLVEGLRNALPEDADAAERKQIDLLVRLSREVDAVVNMRDVVVLVQPERAAFVAAMGALHDALLAVERLPRGHSDRAERAARLRTLAFPEGITFVRKDAAASWSDGDRHLRRIADEGLERELTALVAPEFLAVAKKTTAALGEALGVGRTKRTTPRTTALADQLFLVSRALVRYCRLLIGKVDERDAESVERFRKAVVPIDELRALRGSSVGTVVAEDDAEPITPDVPVTPPVVEPIAS